MSWLDLFRGPANQRDIYELQTQQQEALINARKQAELELQRQGMDLEMQKSRQMQSTADQRLLDGFLQLNQAAGMSPQDAAAKASQQLAEVKTQVPYGTALQAKVGNERLMGQLPIAREAGAKEGLANIAASEAAKSGSELNMLTNKARFQSGPMAANMQDLATSAKAGLSTAIDDTTKPFVYGLIPTQQERARQEAIAGTSAAQFENKVTQQLNPDEAANAQNGGYTAKTAENKLLTTAPLLGRDVNIPQNPIVGSKIFQDPAVLKMISTAIQNATQTNNAPGTPSPSTLPSRRVIGRLPAAPGKLQ